MPEWLTVEWLNQEIYGNTIIAWSVALGLTIVTYLALLTLRRFVGARLIKKTDSRGAAFGSAVGEHVRHTNSLVLVVAGIYLGTYAVTLPPSWGRAITSLTIIAVIIQGAIWCDQLVRRWLTQYIERRDEGHSAAATSAIAILKFLGQLVVWSAALLLVLDNLGVNITALVAGLGVGGVAIGLATQRILGDLFSSLAIVLDQPFVVGDFIIFDDFLGNIERIGLKTTRIRSLGGEQIVCSNSDLLATRIRNYTRMQERRILFTIGVVYQTPFEKLRKIPQILRECVEAQDETRFDRAHFKAYGDFSLIFEIVYYVLKPDYNLYMDKQQAINFAIHQRFEEEGISFAYPTQTLYLRMHQSNGESEAMPGLARREAVEAQASEKARTESPD